MSLILGPLLPSMDKLAFTCGEERLDAWLKTKASQDGRRGFATVIAAWEQDYPEKIIGFYSLSAASINLNSLPAEIAEKLPRYPSIPAIRLGRLAVSLDRQGEHIGTLMVRDALIRSCGYELAWAMMVVDAKDDRVVRFYEKLLFRPLAAMPLTLWMSRKQAMKVTVKS